VRSTNARRAPAGRALGDPPGRGRTAAAV